MNKKKVKKQSSTQIKNKILSTYMRLVKDLNRDPLRSELISDLLTEAKIRHHFESILGLREVARTRYPKVFEKLVTEELFTPEEFEKIKNVVGNYSRFLVFTIVSGCDVDKQAWKSVKEYCRIHDALPLFLPMADPARPKQKISYTFDPILKSQCIIYDDLELNSNLVIRAIKLSAKQMRPFTSLKRLGNRSFVVASPKQELEVIPTSKKYPRLMISPGAITIPNYTTEMYMSKRTSYLAHHDHIMGGVVIELEEDNKTFHTRQIQFDRRGRFIDLGHMYDGNREPKRINPDVFIMGDLHDEEKDETVFECWKQLNQQLPPQYIVLHDVLSGGPISHHERYRYITKSKRHKTSEFTLSEELTELSSTLDDLSTQCKKKLIIVKSNHDEWLDNWLESGEFIKEPGNLRLGLDLAIDLYEDRDPLACGLTKCGMENKDTVFLKRDESFEVAGVELGFHGDQGANGARGSLQTMETAHGNSVTGHTHQGKIMRGAWSVGTTSILRPGYNKGVSSWTHTSCHLYPNGMRQLITVINGKYTI